MGVFLYQSALRDFLRPKRLVVWLLVVAAVFGIAKLWTSLTTGMSPQAAYNQVSAVLVYRVLALTAAIFSTAVVSQEVEQKTIVYLLTRPISRQTLLLARSLAAATVVVAIGWLLAIGVSFAVFGARIGDNAMLVKDLIALGVGALAYTSLFVLLTLWINRAMIVCILFAFGWETMIPNLQGDIYYLSIYKYLETISERPSLESSGPIGALAAQLSTNQMTTQTAWVALVLMIAAFTVVAGWWFTHYEYVPREDAE
jgi:ABC-2 type transport system permease protein